MLGILQSRWYPGDSTLEPTDAQSGMPVENAAEDVLGKHLPERVDVDHHRDGNAVDLAGELRLALADVVRDGQPGLFDLVPYRTHLVARVIDRPAVVVIARADGHQKSLEAQRFQLGQGASRALWVPPVDQTDTVAVTVGAFLDVGDVFVVDAENPLANSLVWVVKQRQHRVGEGQLLVHAILGEFTDASVDVVGGRPGQIVVLHEDSAEIADHDRLPGRAEQIRAVLVPDARRLVFEVVGEALVEDVVGHRDVVVGREDLGAGGQAGVGIRRRDRAGAWGRRSRHRGTGCWAGHHRPFVRSLGQHTEPFEVGEVFADQLLRDVGDGAAGASRPRTGTVRRAPVSRQQRAWVHGRRPAR